jgi:hypothetical protein
LLVAGKLVAAYFRRLRHLASPPWDGVEFLTPLAEPSTTGAAEDSSDGLDLVDEYFEDEEDDGEPMDF